ncbi:DEAD/DEAH box helicase [Roseomonas genomospecies 6]|uniref:Transcription-repair-coupling factor n=1 Tax=Roseomonas genomospecies 6 TaxID=214106 RepID=A0A9W7NG65_9PROT|nr:DEAD/DEAH box helicase [Roseomonas genomospecies 6]KAA0677936.1 transcription-repair coupling factor [Roseomonas genomospecies 6]
MPDSAPLMQFDGAAFAAGRSVTCVAPAEGALAIRLAGFATRSQAAPLVVTRSDSRASRLARAIRDAAPDLDVVLLPSWDIPLGERDQPSRVVLGQRAAAIAALSRQAEGAGRLVLATAEAALQRLPPPDAWPGSALVIATDAPYEEAAWRSLLVAGGYILDDRIDEPGEAAFRGAVVEIFPGDADRPVRCDIVDGRVARIRTFDPVSQRTIGDCGGITVHPVTEIPAAPGIVDRLVRGLESRGDPMAAGLAEELAAGRRPQAFERLLPLAYVRLPSLLELLADSPVVFDEGVGDRLEARLDELAEADASAMHIDRQAWEVGLRGRAVLTLEPEELASSTEEPALSERSLPRIAGERIAAGGSVIVAAANAADAARMAERVAAATGQPVPVLDRWPVDGPPVTPAVLVLRVAAGFAIDGVTVLAQRPRPEGGAGPVAPLAPVDLSGDDLAVHLDYGIGAVRGLETVDAGGQPEDVLVMEYAREDRLLVPAADLDRVWRYGSGDAGVALDGLKGGSWITRRAELEREIGATAKSLVRKAARRARLKAPVIAPPAGPMRRVAARFSYEETAGQRRAIAAVMAELASGRPMDHLVCADVGYGKTEVALRAAAAVAFTGRQVAVLAPTSVLARQHLEVFRRRLAGLGLRIEPLTGGMAASAAKTVREGLADGSVAIAIGTHALLSKTVRFADLALVVVDEEQRFGTAQKRALARLSSGVHSLALSATPVPRTLQGALAGLRGLSVIDTPPVRRRPVRTRVAPHDGPVLRAALLREKARGGQSFCVTPRIADLPALEAEVRALAPGLSVAVAHGRLPAAELDRVMVDVAEGTVDVLVSTPIIETGIDIPRANTIVIRRPDLFGLGQLHQLRGRVGRGTAQAYAYLLTDPDTPLGERTERRLGSLEAIESLGGGFTLSLLDLDRRGAGDLLGTDQSGHLRIVGTELYQHLLARALGGAEADDAPDLRLGVPQTIPAAYLPEEELRIGLHRRLSRLRDEAAVEPLREEIEDRFGPLPEEVELLLAVAALRARCRRLGVAALAAGPSGVSLTLNDTPCRSDREAALEHAWTGRVRRADDRLVFALDAEGPSGVLNNARDVLDRIPPVTSRRVKQPRRAAPPKPQV